MPHFLQVGLGRTHEEVAMYMLRSRTWLKILTTLSEEQRNGLFSAYIVEISQSPQKLISFHLDGILEIFLTLEDNEKEILSNTIKKIINNLDEEKKRRIMMVIPDNAKKQLKF